MNLTTDDADGKIRLDQYLAAHLPELSRSRIQALIKSGDVQINGSAAKPKTPVSRGRLHLRQHPRAGTGGGQAPGHSAGHPV